MNLEKMFKKECEELEIDYAEFPYEFLENSEIYYPSVFCAMMWILKKRQDRMFELQPGLITFDNNGNEVII